MGTGGRRRSSQLNCHSEPGEESVPRPTIVFQLNREAGSVDMIGLLSYIVIHEVYIPHYSTG